MLNNYYIILTQNNFKIRSKERSVQKKRKNKRGREPNCICNDNTPKCTHTQASAKTQAAKTNTNT